MKTKIEISGKQDASLVELTDPRISIKELAELKAISPVRISNGNISHGTETVLQTARSHKRVTSGRNRILADNELENNGAGSETLPLTKKRGAMKTTGQITFNGVNHALEEGIPLCKTKATNYRLFNDRVYNKDDVTCKRCRRLIKEVKRIYRFLDKDTAIVFVCQNLKCSLAKAHQAVEHICEQREDEKCAS